jgi:sulfur relay (sulfurtransferase) complex TusBCD TusD component (DsrE family)
MIMHYVIPATWGPTDTTRASLPFIFAASALQAGDSVMIMLFHDAVTIAVEGAHPKMVPFGPPQRFDEVISNPDAKIVICKPCAEARGIGEEMLMANCTMGGMNDFHEQTSRTDSKVVAF